MNHYPDTDVLLVGADLASCIPAAVRTGLTARTAPSCLDAVAQVARTATKVVVVSGAEVDGRVPQALAALHEGIRRPSILVTVAPGLRARLDPAEHAGIDDMISEPCLPEDVLSRARALIRRRESGVDTAEAGSPRNSLEATLADLRALSEQVASLEELKDKLFEAFVERTGARRASLLSRLTVREGNTESEVLFIERARGLPKGIEIGTCLPLGQGIAGRVAETCRPLLLEDIPRSPYRALANRGPYRTDSCMSIPLKVKDRLLGIINLSDREGDTRFEEPDLKLQAGFADHAAQILLNSRRLERMTRLSILDDLTGLYNRRFFRKSLEREFKRAMRYERPLTLAILDVDHFKVFNDANGHEAGNRILARIGDILRRSFRNTDIVARYGGEEFAVIFPEIEKGAEGSDGVPTGAYAVLERLRQRIETTPFPGEQVMPGGRLTISGGASCLPIDAETVSEILDAADAALYRAKDTGRNRIILAEPAAKAADEEE